MIARFLNRHLILPLSDLVLRQSISANLRFLRESQFWDKDKLNEFQFGKLAQLLKHANDHVAFYRKWFSEQGLSPADIKNPDDLAMLPVVSKEDIRSDPKSFMSEVPVKSGMIRMFSSGSTGEPFEYFVSRQAFSMKYAAAIRGWEWMGYRLGDPYAKLSQNQRSSFIKKLQDFVNRSAYIYIPDLSRDTLLLIIERLHKDPPEYLRCYPDPLYFMAKILKSVNRKLKGIKAINSTGNILSPEARQLIEDRFNCPVYDAYSCEGSALFYENPPRDAYLGSSEYAITEVLSSGTDGNSGLHVTTDLWNFAMPMIRYNTRDLVVKAENIPSCGRKLFPLEKIIGRENDILVTPDGNLLIVHLFTIYFEYFEGITQFQIEQKSEIDFVFRLVTNEKFTKENFNEIEQHWKSVLGKKAALKMDIMDKIPVLYSGKRRFLIRNPEIPLPY